MTIIVTSNSPLTTTKFIKFKAFIDQGIAIAEIEKYATLMREANQKSIDEFFENLSVNDRKELIEIHRRGSNFKAELANINLDKWI